MNLYRYAENNPLSYVDPLGLWNRDVHEGAVGQNYGTITCAIQVGFPVEAAKAIGAADINTDNVLSTSPLPWGSPNNNIVGRSRHFKIPLDAHTDSRDTWAAFELINAIEAWKKGNLCEAYEALGRGLHSLQDKIAHGNWDNEHHPYTYHGATMDSWADRPDVHAAVEQTTKAYLGQFVQATRVPQM